MKNQKFVLEFNAITGDDEEVRGREIAKIGNFKVQKISKLKLERNKILGSKKNSNFISENTPNNAKGVKGAILTPSTGLVTSRPEEPGFQKNEKLSESEDFEVMGIKASQVKEIEKDAMEKEPKEEEVVFGRILDLPTPF